jgi:hypothetical protein
MDTICLRAHFDVKSWSTPGVLQVAAHLQQEAMVSAMLRFTVCPCVAEVQQCTGDEYKRAALCTAGIATDTMITAATAVQGDNAVNGAASKHVEVQQVAIPLVPVSETSHTTSDLGSDTTFSLDDGSTTTVHGLTCSMVTVELAAALVTAVVQGSVGCAQLLLHHLKDLSGE